MNVLVYSINPSKNKILLPAINEYSKRIKYFVNFKFIEVKSLKLEHIKKFKNKFIFALDEEGELLNSLEFANKIRDFMEDNLDIVFIVGDANGLPSDVIKNSNMVLSLSKLTLPHLLARVVLIEQLYRSFSIINNIPYHKG
ncbi:MAG: ribosomal RNA large subunit methyltransferase H [Thiotrichaceae bacterium]|jgi:23S rRNA (pseudouridine1915-N3)-methyltransferase|nr:MAG: ribosomal RNA large subunit methyltransferase H [Thiotrichaceae bacterium]|tara:strand:- start:15779 stop:16201 length:423 start_codon:yes stop_codon:yes gene_type:complete